jgi:hypothetical protein
MGIIENILEEWAYRVDNGMPNPKDKNHLRELAVILDELELGSIKNELIENLLNETSEDDKYEFIGYGRYKEKGKKDDPDAPTFRKDDVTKKYIMLGQDKDEPTDKTQTPNEEPKVDGGEDSTGDGGEDSMGDGGEEPQQPDPAQMFAKGVDVAYDDRLDTERELQAQLAKGDVSDTEKNNDTSKKDKYEKLKPADKVKLVLKKIEQNDVSFNNSDNKEKHTLSLLQNRNDEINDNYMLPAGNTGSSFAENNGAYYIQEIFSKGGKLSKEDIQRILSEIQSTKLGQSMPEADRKRWVLIALETAITEANVLLTDTKYNAKTPQPEGYPQGAIMDKQNKASVGRILQYKLNEAEKSGDTTNVKHYKKQLRFLDDLKETDAGILYITNDNNIGFKHTSNKSSYDDPHSNTSPNVVINSIKNILGSGLATQLESVFNNSLEKLSNSNSGVQGDVQKFNSSRQNKSEGQIKAENEIFAEALTNFPIFGGGRKDYLTDKVTGVVNKTWFKTYTEEKGLSEPYQNSDILNAVFENAASDKPDTSAQKIITKISEIVEKTNDNNFNERAKKFNLTTDKLSTIMQIAGDVFKETAKGKRDVMAEVHRDIVAGVQNADMSDINAYPNKPTGDNGPHQRAYVSGFLQRMHFDSYILGIRDGVASQNISGDNVEPEYYRVCLSELTGYDGDTTTEGGRSGLVDYLSKRIRISPDNDSISFETREGNVVKLGVDKYRTKGDAKGVLGSLGKDLKTCLKHKAKK